MKYLMLFFMAVTTVFSACERDENLPDGTECDQLLVVDGEQYDSVSAASFFILDAAIEEDCLNIEFSASGCDGNSWEFTLIDSEAVAESLPVQRFLKVAFKNEEACLAVFQQKHSFDLRPARVADNNTVLFNLESWEQQLRYEY